jgi:diaminopimelate epimerase
MPAITHPTQRVRFTKMQGAGNDFVVLDETRGQLGLSAAQYRFLANRHFGVGADQILTVRPAPSPEVDFEYVIHNADGGEVEQCGNGSRCFVRYVVDKGLTAKTAIKVQTRAGVLEPRLMPDGLVTVDMGSPVFDLARVPFNAAAATRTESGDWEKWVLVPPLKSGEGVTPDLIPDPIPVMAVVSMGNPHAVAVVADADAAPVATTGPWVQAQAAFPRGVNVGFMQILARDHIRLRVFERGAGETLACGSGACAAVVAGIRLGVLDSPVQVDMLGGVLCIGWTGGDAHVMMSGPAVTVFEGEIEVPTAIELPLNENL